MSAGEMHSIPASIWDTGMSPLLELLLMEVKNNAWERGKSEKKKK